MQQSHPGGTQLCDVCYPLISDRKLPPGLVCPRYVPLDILPLIILFFASMFFIQPPRTPPPRRPLSSLCAGTDIDECGSQRQPCSATFNCVNTVGSYRCQRKIICSRGYHASPDGSSCIGGDRRHRRLRFSTTPPSPSFLTLVFRPCVSQTWTSVRAACVDVAMANCATTCLAPIAANVRQATSMTHSGGCV